jgi:hypothetical protein
MKRERKMHMMAPISASGVSATLRIAKALAPAPKSETLRLSAEHIAHARAFLEASGMPAGHLENVRFVKGMKGHGWIVEQALKNGNPAITRGDIVYVREDKWDYITSPRYETFWSEIYHTSQYQDGSFESRYLSGMIGSVLIGGDGHKGNIMEEVAHSRGAKMAETWNAQHR